jgi:hypothetical protein
MTKEGERRTVLEVEADDVAASLKFASAKVTRVARSRPARDRGLSDRVRPVGVRQSGWLLR